MPPVAEIEITEDGKVVWLKGFGEIKGFRLIDKHGNAEHWATNFDLLISKMQNQIQ